MNRIPVPFVHWACVAVVTNHPSWSSTPSLYLLTVPAPPPFPFQWGDESKCSGTMVAKPPLRRRAFLTVDVPLALLGTSARMPHHATTDAPVAPVFGHTHAPWVVHLPYLSHSPLSLSDPQPGHDANALLGGQPQFSLPVRQVRGLVQGQNHIHPAMEQTGGESSLATQPHPAAALSSRTQLPHPAAAPNCRRLHLSTQLRAAPGRVFVHCTLQTAARCVRLRNQELQQRRRGQGRPERRPGGAAAAVQDLPRAFWEFVAVF